MAQSFSSSAPSGESATAEAGDVILTPMGGQGRIWFPHALRGIANVIVAACHLGVMFPMSQTTIALLTWSPPLRDLPQPLYLRVLSALGSPDAYLAPLAVSLMFLISGFVIPYSLEQRTRGGFVLRRVFRLYPTLWLVEGMVLALLILNGRIYYFPYPGGWRTLLTNAFLVNTFFGEPFLEGACWSMVVEEFFYLICTLGSSRLTSSRSAILLTCAGLAGITLWRGAALLPATPGLSAARVGFWLSYFTPFVIFVFIGVVFHQLYRGRWRMSECCLLTAVLLGLYSAALYRGPMTATNARFYLIASPLAIGVFLTLLLLSARLPYSRLLDRMGEISYPFYLLHGTCGYLLMRVVYLHVHNFTVALSITFAAVILAAVLVHRWIEKPANEWGRRVVRRMGLWIKTGPRKSSPGLPQLENTTLHSHRWSA